MVRLERDIAKLIDLPVNNGHKTAMRIICKYSPDESNTGSSGETDHDGE